VRWQPPLTGQCSTPSLTIRGTVTLEQKKRKKEKKKEEAKALYYMKQRSIDLYIEMLSVFLSPQYQVDIFWCDSKNNYLINNLMVINSKSYNDFHSEKSTLENINLGVNVAFFFSLISFFPSHLDLLERERKRKKQSVWTTSLLFRLLWEMWRDPLDCCMYCHGSQPWTTMTSSSLSASQFIKYLWIYSAVF